MKDYRYLIIGGGMAAATAVKNIRKHEAEGSLAILGEEEHPPYKRPPLSKGLWKGKPFKMVWMGVENQDVDLLLGRRAVSVDPAEKVVTDDRGEKYRYEKLLIATGGTPIHLPFGGDEVIYYRTLDDYQRLQELAQPGVRFGVIGGGFIGSEIAAALASQGEDVVMVFPEQGIGANNFPKDLSDYITQYYREKGVEVLTGRMVKDIRSEEGKMLIETDQGESIQVDHVVAGIGIRPNTALAKEAGLQVENGILVNEYLQTSQPDIYAAGDVASFVNPQLDRRLRVEHEDNALWMGQVAGENMAGERIPYDHLPFFYSDLFELGYEAVGELNSKLEVIADWDVPYHKGVLYYLDESQNVRGVLLWDVWGKVDEAREWIGKPLPVQAG